MAGVYLALQEASGTLGKGVLDLVVGRSRRCSASSAEAVCASYHPAMPECDVNGNLLCMYIKNQ